MNEKLIDLVKTIINSDLPIGTRTSIVSHYMLPKPGMTRAVIQDSKVDVGTVERPTKEDIEIENNPKLKAEYEDTTKLMAGELDEE